MILEIGFFNLAVQYAAEAVENDGFDDYVLTQPVELDFANIVIFYQLEVMLSAGWV